MHRREARSDNVTATIPTAESPELHITVGPNIDIQAELRNNPDQHENHNISVTTSIIMRIITAESPELITPNGGISRITHYDWAQHWQQRGAA
jgi:hypothetical protein